MTAVYSCMKSDLVYGNKVCITQVTSVLLWGRVLKAQEDLKMGNNEMNELMRFDGKNEGIKKVKKI